MRRGLGNNSPGTTNGLPYTIYAADACGPSFGIVRIPNKPWYVQSKLARRAISAAFTDLCQHSIIGLRMVSCGVVELDPEKAGEREP